MTGYEFIGWTLNNTSAVTAITSTRIYHGLRSRTTTVPAINFFAIGGGDRWQGLERQTYSINCRAATPGAARDLARVVITALDGSAGQGLYGTSNGFDLGRASLRADQGLIPEPEDDMYNAPVDVQIIYPSSTVS